MDEPYYTRDRFTAAIQQYAIFHIFKGNPMNTIIIQKFINNRLVEKR